MEQFVLQWHQCIQKNADRRAYIVDTELINLRKIICLSKFEVSIERISVCDVIEHLAEHGIHFLSCSYTNDVINMLPS